MTPPDPTPPDPTLPAPSRTTPHLRASDEFLQHLRHRARIVEEDETLTHVDVVGRGQVAVELDERAQHRVAELAVLNERHGHGEGVLQHTSHVVLRGNHRRWAELVWGQSVDTASARRVMFVGEHVPNGQICSKIVRFESNMTWLLSSPTHSCQQQEGHSNCTPILSWSQLLLPAAQRHTHPTPVCVLPPLEPSGVATPSSSYIPTP